MKPTVIVIMLWFSISSAQIQPAQEFSQIETNPTSTMVFYDQPEQLDDNVVVQPYYDLDGNVITPEESKQNWVTTSMLVDGQQPDLDLAGEPEIWKNEANLSNPEMQSQDAEFTDTQQEMENSYPVELQDDNNQQEQQQEQQDDNNSDIYRSATFEMPIETTGVYDSLGNEVEQTDGLNTFITTGNGILDENKVDKVIDEKNVECITIYSKCNYQGDSMEACESLKQVENFTHQIRSIYIPNGMSVTLYRQSDFKGDKTVYTSSMPCLTHPISFTQLQQTTLSHNNLRVGQLVW